MLTRLVRTGILGAGVAALALSATTATAVAALTVTIDPATAVPDGATVVVTIAGYPKNATVLGGICALKSLPDNVACDPASKVEIKTDRSGGGAETLVAHKVYDAVDKDGKPAGKVDCGSQRGGCFVGAVEPTERVTGQTPIKFK